MSREPEGSWEAVAGKWALPGLGNLGKVGPSPLPTQDPRIPASAESRGSLQRSLSMTFVDDGGKVNTEIPKPHI